jgi:DNA transformation protein
MSDIDVDHITELFAEFGRVAVRRMFSGAGVFADGLMIALVVRGVIYLKADDETVPQFEREGLGPFTYKTKTGERSLNSYWRMPERLYDEPEELAAWAKHSLEVARRKEARSRRPKKKEALERGLVDGCRRHPRKVAVAQQAQRLHATVRRRR